jgi:hypothetical protein
VILCKFLLCRNLKNNNDQMKEKYSKITINILISVFSIFLFFGIDKFLLHHIKIKDKITAYSIINISSSSRFGTGTTKNFVGIKFYTEKDYEFTLRKSRIEEEEVEIWQSPVFHSINKVKTKFRDYSEELASGLNGICFYLAIGIMISITISLLLLHFVLNLTENGFQNIILFNGFLIIVYLYLFMIFK